jgi:uncharacterized OsmC-like protein
MVERYEVKVGAGTLRSVEPEAVSMPHRWTPGGVTVEGAFTGAHLLHLAVAGCVLNDLYRESPSLGIVLDGVRVRAWGGFDDDTSASTGIAYTVELASGADEQQLAALLERVDEIAEIPRAVRAGAVVRRSAEHPG